jgi:hypothetical protein
MVAGDEDVDSRTLQNIPVFDQGNVETWVKDLRIALMARHRNHLGLGARPVVNWQGTGTPAQRAKFDKEEEIWLERKDTCVCAIYAAVKEDPVAREVVDQYLTEKEIAAAVNADQGETLASEIIGRLTTRFRGDVQDEINVWNSKFTSYVISPTETSSAGIDRLNGIIQKLRQHGQEPTDASKLSKLKEALEIPSLEQLWMTIAMLENPSYEAITSTCKRYDKAISQKKF